MDEKEAEARPFNGNHFLVGNGFRTLKSISLGGNSNKAPISLEIMLKMYHREPK